MNKDLLLASALVLGTVSAPVLASKGAENGQPFKALQSQIDQNRSLIAANAGAIQNLNERVASINEGIAGLNGAFDELASQVTNNSRRITNALSRLDTTEGAVDSLRFQLDDLAQLHSLEIAAINSQLESVRSELSTLNELRRELAEELHTALAALSGTVDQNALAIDNLLLQLVTVNAQLTSINSSILDLNHRDSELRNDLNNYGSQLADLEALVRSLQQAISDLTAFSFEGIQTNLPIESLTGWTQCFSARYSENARPESMMSACSGSKIMLACRATGSDTLAVAAYANRDEVFLNTGDNNNVVHTANGVDWYFSLDWSMGFAPVGEGVSRGSADTMNASSPLRLSWHTRSTTSAGWRCGSNTGLNSSNAWEKLIFEAL